MTLICFSLGEHPTAAGSVTQSPDRFSTETLGNNLYAIYDINHFYCLIYHSLYGHTYQGPIHYNAMPYYVKQQVPVYLLIRTFKCAESPHITILCYMTASI